jgi:hypothetical protein
MARLVAAYPNLFGKTGEAREEEPVDEDNWFAARYGWLATIDAVAKDRTQWDFFLMMPIVEFLNYLCFLRDKNEYQSRRQHETTN